MSFDMCEGGQPETGSDPKGNLPNSPAPVPRRGWSAAWRRFREVSWVIWIPGSLIALLVLGPPALKWVSDRYLQRAGESLANWIDRQPVGPALIVTLVAGLLATFFLLGLFYKQLDQIEELKRRELLWLYIIVALLGLNEAVQLWFYLFRPSGYLHQLQHHPLTTRLNVQFNVGVTLIVVGAVIYLFKRFAELPFAISEIVLAVVSQAALIARIDFSSPPKIKISTPDLLLLIGATYVLSKGISDVVEGLSKNKAKTAALRSDTVSADGRPGPGSAQPRGAQPIRPD